MDITCGDVKMMQRIYKQPMENQMPNTKYTS
jgi:hypothetical protein